MLVYYEQHKIAIRYGEWYPPIQESLITVTSTSVGTTISGYSSYKFLNGQFSFDGCTPVSYTASASGSNNDGAYTSFSNGDSPYVVYKEFSGDAALNNICINTYYAYADRPSTSSCGDLITTISAEDGTYPSNGIQNGYWYVRKGAINTPPVISGSDQNLGNEMTPFSVNYTITDSDSSDATLQVQESLDGINLRTYTANSGTQYTVSLSGSQFYNLIEGSHTLRIDTTDSIGNKVTRKYTFIKVNTPPIIDGTDSDLGTKGNSFAINYTISSDNPDASTFDIVVTLDDTTLKSFAGVKNLQYTAAVQDSTFFKLENGQHIITIAATDKSGTSKRQYTFTKNETSIDVTLSKIIDTDTKATQILLTPDISGLNNNTIVIKATNNAYDISPTWEDITASAMSNTNYTFTNNTKTADKWGVSLQFLITKTNSADNIILKGFKAEINVW